MINTHSRRESTPPQESITGLLDKLVQSCRLKRQLLRHPSMRNDRFPAIAEINAALVRYSPEGFRSMVAAQIDNKTAVNFLVNRYSRLLSLISAQRSDNPDLASILKEDVILERRILRDISQRCSSKRRIDVIGYGEITSSLVLSNPELPRTHSGLSQWVYKTLPKFPSEASVIQYTTAFDRYVELLTGFGLTMPEQKIRRMGDDPEGIRVYVVQRRLPSDRMGDQLLKSMSLDSAIDFIMKVVNEMKPVFAQNMAGDSLTIALDGQISNWWYDDATGEMIYIDTSTPLFRLDGEEQLDPEIFLKNTPSFLRAVIRKFFLQQVLDRYYDFRSVLIDMIANFYKEQRSDIVYPVIDEINRFIDRSGDEFGMEPVTRKEVDGYYREDAFIWRFFQASRKVDRFITEKLLRKPYTFRLPEDIQR